MRVSPAVGEYAITEADRLRAVNAELVAALDEALNQLDTLQMERKGSWTIERSNMVSAARHGARAALAKARA
jgi:hypothetical protein